jgi:hypothetical protein
MALGLNQPLIEMSTRNLPRGKWQPAHKADNLTPTASRLSRNCGSLNISQTYGPPWSITETASPYFHTQMQALLHKKYTNYQVDKHIPITKISSNFSVTGQSKLHCTTAIFIEISRPGNACYVRRGLLLSRSCGYKFPQMKRELQPHYPDHGPTGMQQWSTELHWNIGTATTHAAEIWSMISHTLN